MFTLAGVAILPNGVNAQNDDPWADPNDNVNLIWDWTQTLTWSALLDTAKNTINWIMGILATIALVICLYGGFKMMTSAWDEKKYGDWLKVLKNAAIGLAIIALSWMIVSIVFWLIKTVWGSNQTQTTWQQQVDVSSGEWTSLRGWSSAADAPIPR